jgi:hypothetical protein
MTKDTSGSEFAFPSTFKSLHPEEQQVHRWGMTLRDYFAAKAMETLVHNRTPWDAAAEAYAYADEMLKARNK